MNDKNYFLKLTIKSSMGMVEEINEIEGKPKGLSLNEILKLKDIANHSREQVNKSLVEMMRNNEIRTTQNGFILADNK